MNLGEEWFRCNLGSVSALIVLVAVLLTLVWLECLPICRQQIFFVVMLVSFLHVQ